MLEAKKNRMSLPDLTEKNGKVVRKIYQPVDPSGIFSF